MLRHRDVALYAAKRSGRNAFAWFDEELERELTEWLKLEEEIRRGIKAGEFYVDVGTIEGYRTAIALLAAESNARRFKLRAASTADAAEPSHAFERGIS